MEMSELVSRLYQYNEDCEQGYILRIKLSDICHDCLMAANKIVSLQSIIDDMLGDHYVDYLEFYANRCRELEEKLEKINKILEE